MFICLFYEETCPLCLDRISDPAAESDSDFPILLCRFVVAQCNRKAAVRKWEGCEHMLSGIWNHCHILSQAPPADRAKDEVKVLPKKLYYKFSNLRPMRSVSCALVCRVAMSKCPLWSKDGSQRVHCEEEGYCMQKLKAPAVAFKSLKLQRWLSE